MLAIKQLIVLIRVLQCNCSEQVVPDSDCL